VALTPKQQDFCDHIVDGCTQSEAYRRAYNADNMLDATIHQEASRVANDRNVSARIQQMREQLAERLLFPRIERLEILKGIAQGGERDGDRINAIKVFSEFIGDSAPIKMQIEHSGAIASQKTADEMTDDELATIATSGG
jgi:phage terminase small subunit